MKKYVAHYVHASGNSTLRKFEAPDDDRAKVMAVDFLDRIAGDLGEGFSLAKISVQAPPIEHEFLAQYYDSRISERMQFILRAQNWHGAILKAAAEHPHLKIRSIQCLTTDGPKTGILDADDVYEFQGDR